MRQFSRANFHLPRSNAQIAAARPTMPECLTATSTFRPYSHLVFEVTAPSGLVWKEFSFCAQRRWASRNEFSPRRRLRMPKHRIRPSWNHSLSFYRSIFPVDNPRGIPVRSPRCACGNPLRHQSPSRFRKSSVRWFIGSSNATFGFAPEYKFPFPRCASRRPLRFPTPASRDGRRDPFHRQILATSTPPIPLLL